MCSSPDLRAEAYTPLSRVSGSNRKRAAKQGSAPNNTDSEDESQGATPYHPVTVDVDAEPAANDEDEDDLTTKRVTRSANSNGASSAALTTSCTGRAEAAEVRTCVSFSIVVLHHHSPPSVPHPLT